MDDAVVNRANEFLSDRGADWAAVTAGGDWLLARSDETGFLVDLAAGEVRNTFPTSRDLGPTPDATGSAFVTATDDGVEIRTIPDGGRRHAFPVTPASRTAAGRNLLAPGGDAVYLHADPAIGWARYVSETSAADATYPPVEDDEMGLCFALSADGSRAVVGGIKSPVSGGFLAFYEAETGELVEHETLPYEVDRVALSPDGSEAAVCDGVGGLTGTGWRAEDLDGVVADAQFVRNGREVVSLTAEGTLDRWDVESGDRLGSHDADEPARVLLATTDGELVALSGTTARLVVPEWAA